MIERKCLKCATWNNEEQFCKNCGAALAPEQIQREEDQIKRKAEALKKPDKLDVLLNKAKNSKFLPVRVAYYILYSGAVIVFAIASFAMYLIAWSPA